jgi:hypothetical protein
MPALVHSLYCCSEHVSKTSYYSCCLSDEQASCWRSHQNEISANHSWSPHAMLFCGRHVSGVELLTKQPPCVVAGLHRLCTHAIVRQQGHAINWQALGRCADCKEVVHNLHNAP